MLPYLFRPDGKVNQEDLPNGDARCHYQVAHVPGDPDNPFEATLVFAKGQLKELSAKSTSNLERTFPPTTFTPRTDSRPLGSSNLATLPNETLDRIAGHTASTNPNGLLALRQTQWHLNAIADSHITPAQRFRINHGQMLHAAGHDADQMRALAIRPEEEREAVMEGLKTEG
ncbi:hypothetical protein ACFQDN_20160 [Pseudomonas asuensis]|uniref:hypothetical protein n=1 Tax=Pseudomonas asuensis TaxID=1825787 RepID=UPI00166D6AAB|nr:hypothetical protein [Pseudomonas asuensis]